jgi:hypothetical protein
LQAAGEITLCRKEESFLPVLGRNGPSDVGEARPRATSAVDWPAHTVDGSSWLRASWGHDLDELDE